MKKCLWLLLLILIPVLSTAQEIESIIEPPSPRGALLRSFVMPGWGHHYIDKTNWTRGQYHMGAEAVMILSYVGIRARTNYLEDNLITYARSESGMNLNNRDRDIFLAIANFDNLEEYNDYQLRARSWDALLADVPANQWNWSNDEARFRYQDMRERIDRNNNQLPALLTMMVANRIISGISAFTQARKMNINLPEARVSYLNEFGEPGLTATVSFALD